MIKKFCGFALLSLLLLNVSGCAAPLIIGAAAGGAGTAVWLSDKLAQEVNAPLDRAVKAAKAGLRSLNLVVTKETVEENNAQIMSTYTDGKTIWVDVRRITDSSSKIEVRVGAVNPDKEAAGKILNSIVNNL